MRNKTRRAGRALGVLVAAVGGSAAARSALAANYVWDATGPSANWNAEGTTKIVSTTYYDTNWGDLTDSPVFPPSDPSTTIEFSTNGSGTTAQDLDDPFELNGLTFDSGAASFGIAGDALEFAADGSTTPSINQNSSNQQTISAPVTLESDLSVNVSGSGNLLISGAITGGSNGIYKYDSGGNLILSGGTNASPSAFSFLHVAAGTAILNGGVLNLSATGSTGFSGESSLFVENGATLDLLNGTQLTTYATPQVHGTGTIYVDGGTWTDDNAPSGPAADIRIGYAGAGSYLEVEGNGQVISQGDMTIGNSSLTSNPGTGSVTIFGGSSVSVAGNLVMDTTSQITNMGGTITAGALSSVAGSSPSIAMANPTGGIALTVGSANTNSTFAGAITDYFNPGTLEKVGTGTLILSSAGNTYSGGTIISAGAVQVGGGTAAGSLGTGSVTDNANLVIDDDSSFTSANAPFVFSNNITGTGSVTITSSNSYGVAEFTGTNSYAGGTTIDNSALFVSTDANLGASTGPVTLNNGVIIANASFSSSRAIAVTGSSAINPLGNTVTLTGQLSGAGELQPYDGGTLILTGAGSTLGSLSFMGGYPASVILDGSSGGSLTLSDTGSTGAIGGNSSLFVEGGSTLTVRNGFTLNTTDTPQMHNNSTMIVDGPGTTWNNTANGTDLAQIRVGYFGQTSILTVQNSATVNTPNMLVSDGANGGVGNLNITSGAQVNVANEMFLSDGAAIVVNAGTLTVGFLDDEYFNGGTSSIALTDPVGSSALVINENASGVVSYNGAITDGPGGPGGITFNGAFEEDLTNASYSGPTTVNNGTLDIINNTHTGSFTANDGATLNISSATLNPGVNSLTANGNGVINYISSTINGGFIRGVGTQGFQDAQVNGSTILSGAQIYIAAPSGFTNVTSSATIDAATTLTWDGGLQTTAGSTTVYTSLNTDQFENDGIIHVFGYSATLSNTQTDLVNGDGASVQVDSGGTISLNSTGLDLRGASLENDGVIAGGPTNIYFNSVAKGTGTFGPINLNSGGTFSPGDGPGSAASSDVTWAGGGTYLFEMANATGAAGTGWDLWNINGSLNLTGTATDPMYVDFMPLNVTNFNVNDDYQWLIANVTDSTSGFNADDFVVENPTGLARYDGYYTVAEEGTSLYLVYDPINVPEPATAAMLVLPLVGLGLRRRARRR